MGEPVTGSVYIGSRKVPRECLHSLGNNQGEALWKCSLENAVQPVRPAAELLLQPVAVLIFCYWANENN